MHRTGSAFSVLLSVLAVPLFSLPATGASMPISIPAQLTHAQTEGNSSSSRRYHEILQRDPTGAHHRVTHHSSVRAFLHWIQ